MGQIATVTIGSDTFSVYAITTDAVADATSYFNGQLGASAAAWSAAVSDDKKKSLVMAADWMDRAVSFSGTLHTVGQPRAFPRDALFCGTTSLGDNVTPDNVARAEFELAGILLQDASQSASSGTGANIRGVKAGSASVDFFFPTIGNPKFDHRLPQIPWDLLKCLFNGAGSAGVGFFGGSEEDNETHFDEDDFDKSRPFA